MGKAICSKVRLQIDPGAVIGDGDRGGERSGCVDMGEGAYSAAARLLMTEWGVLLSNFSITALRVLCALS